MLRRAATAFQKLWGYPTAALHGKQLQVPRSFATAEQASRPAGTAATPGPLGIVLFIPSIVCGYLGYWQYERMQWKDSLIKLRTEMLKAPARDIYSDGEIQDYEKVSASGVFLHDKSVFIGPRPRSVPGMGIQSGFLLITPLYEAKRNATVMVNRGWVPRSWEDNLEALESSCPGQTQVTAVVQPSEKPSAAVPDNVPDRLEFHWVDVPSLARSCGLPPDTPLIQAISDSPATAQQMRSQSPLEAKRAAPMDYGPPKFPIPKNSADLVRFATMPFDHMMYSATWAMLFVALGFMARQAVFFPAKHKKIIGNKHLWRSVVREE